jgi:hypothetical protein
MEALLSKNVVPKEYYQCIQEPNAVVANTALTETPAGVYCPIEIIEMPGL